MYILCRRAIVTDEYLSAKGAEGSIYAIGDCQTVEEKSMAKEVRVPHLPFFLNFSAISVFQVDRLFAEADVNGDGKVTAKEFNALMEKCGCQYPQISLNFCQSWDEKVEKSAGRKSIQKRN